MRQRSGIWVLRTEGVSTTKGAAANPAMKRAITSQANPKLNEESSTPSSPAPSPMRITWRTPRILGKVIAITQLTR
ncbi:MAG TPA: hypothetical protein QF626_03135 [Prochlorococcaceae cyanobacterium Fu_MAG_50]|nr:hypothetical protein [Prochlorococcaceae cyanobacterium Fu_MAG_50]